MNEKRQGVDDMSDKDPSDRSKWMKEGKGHVPVSKGVLATVFKAIGLIGASMVSETVRSVYDRTVREYLPRKIAIHNTVPARNPRLFDATDRFPRYEDDICTAMREHVSPTDSVVVIGGGIGVTSVVAARNGNDVVTYEAARERYELLRETVIMNGENDSIDCKNALVGEDVNVRGKTSKVTTDPSELPECDVIEIDAEGAELGILESLEIRPRTIIVETHPQYGCPNGSVRETLFDMGYDVIDDVVNDRETGMMVMTASSDQRDV